MSAMPFTTGAFSRHPNFGHLLAGLAAGAPAGLSLDGSAPFPEMAPAPLPASSSQSASPASGGVSPPPMTGGEPIRGLPAPATPLGTALGETLLPPSDIGLRVPIPAPAPASEPNGMSRGQIIAGIVADALAGAAGREGQFAQHLGRLNQQEAQRTQEEARWHRDRSAKREDDMRPRVEQVGDSIGMLDPSAQSFQPFYRKPQAFEAYAQAQGLQPGTAEYAQAVEDYRLGSWSDPALENRTNLEEVKATDRHALETFRQAEHLRQLRERTSVTRRGQDMTDARVRQRSPAAPKSTGPKTEAALVAELADRWRKGGTLNAREQQLVNEYRARQNKPRGRGPTAKREAMAIGPDGRRIVVRGGKWVDAETGKPVQ